ncbi:unnamed protein product [Adineta steineri]|uniref:Uncharacterized protein n=1 Tax=Adineta steineri TaxID=433720 RepID=A0A813UP59_9BILA|nr:unnamed protein product [Adineta steineri]CAF4028020.1 unnamed protein product [Adineta steineri]
MLFSNTIIPILEQNTVPKDLDYLSCDMDPHDLWVFRSILQAGYRPRVITTEYNSNYLISDALTLIDPTIVDNGLLTTKYTFKFQQCAWGTGAAALRMVAEAHGYTMVGRVGYLDLVWVRSDLLSKECVELPTFEWFFRGAVIGQLHHEAQISPEVLSQIVDYKTYIQTGGDIIASQRAARIILKRSNLTCFAGIQKFL